jgi:ABC-type uncharacterized transport system auxiliary subunit
MRRLAIIAGSLVLLTGGCSIQKSVPPVATYRIAVEPAEAAYAGTQCRDKTLRIALLEGSELFRSRTIHYVDDTSKQYGYTKARWAESPSKQLRYLLERSVAQSGLFNGVIPYRSQAKNDLLLETNVNSFLQVIHEDGSSVAELSMTQSLIDQFSGKILATKRIMLSKEAASADVEGAVDAFNALVSEALLMTNRWLDDECRSPLPPEGEE